MRKVLVNFQNQGGKKMITPEEASKNILSIINPHDIKGLAYYHNNQRLRLRLRRNIPIEKIEEIYYFADKHNLILDILFE
jgi:hypothetical protein